VASPPDLDTLPVADPYGNGSDAGPTAPHSTIRVSGAVRQPTTQDSENGGAATRRGRHGAAEVPVVTGVPVSRPTSSGFDVFTPLHRPGGDGAAQGDAPYAEQGYGNIGGDGDGYPAGNVDGGGNSDYKGLPRRVRQANLAPQLRSSAAAGPDGPTGVPRASAASLSDMRNTLSAMQRGWQQGRAQSQQDSEGGVDGD